MEYPITSASFMSAALAALNESKELTERDLDSTEAAPGVRLDETDALGSKLASEGIGNQICRKRGFLLGEDSAANGGRIAPGSKSAITRTIRCCISGQPRVMEPDKDECSANWIEIRVASI